MWDGDGSQVDMMGWSNWLLSFQGILSIASLITIFVVGFALFRDWRRDRVDSSGSAASERE